MERGRDDPLMNCRCTGWLNASLNLEKMPVATLCVFLCMCVLATLRVSLKMRVNQHLVCVLGVVSTKSLVNSRFHMFPLPQVKYGKGFS